jgi:hypothetical protein
MEPRVYVILAYPKLSAGADSQHRMLEQRLTWRQNCFSSLMRRKRTRRYPRPRPQPQVLMYTLSLCLFSRCVHCRANIPVIIPSLQILTAKPPKARPSRPIVTTKTLADLRPKREDYEERAVPQRTWSVLDRCWTFEPLLRPSILEVLRGLVLSLGAA